LIDKAKVAIATARHHCDELTALIQGVANIHEHDLWVAHLDALRMALRQAHQELTDDNLEGYDC
jgi:hypothetical protein